MIRNFSPPSQPINMDSINRKIEVDRRISLSYYYRIAETLLKRADVYRREKNIVDLYVMLIRFCSLVSETIPFHQDYQSSYPKQRAHFKKILLDVIDELEALKPEFQYRISELNKTYADAQQNQSNGQEMTSYGSHNTSLAWPSINIHSSEGKQLQPTSKTLMPSWNQNNEFQTVSSTNIPFEKQFSKLSLSVPLPKQETLSRHTLLGPSGLRSQWQGPSTNTKVFYPSHTDISSSEDLRLFQDRPSEVQAQKGEIIGQDMDAILSLDDGRWSLREEDMPGIIRQPVPPPVLAQVQPAVRPISPSRVADPRPGQAKSSDDGIRNPNSFQDLHIPVKMMEDFLRLAQKNTVKNLETCGVLAGSLKNRVFHITSLIIPKQESTSDSCQTLNEEDIFEVQDRLSLFPLGWIHTHPTQTCFMSSVDLHTHYSYQIMLPEAIAIVMAPTDSSSPHGIFHLSDPGGISVIRNCDQRGFHPHEEPSDGSSLYEHCSHVYMNPKLKFDVVDLR